MQQTLDPLLSSILALPCDQVQQIPLIAQRFALGQTRRLFVGPFHRWQMQLRETAGKCCFDVHDIGAHTAVSFPVSNSSKMASETGSTAIAVSRAGACSSVIRAVCSALRTC